MITRLDVLLIVFYQLLLLFNVQLLMPIFLNYMPTQKCEGLSYLTGVCYPVEGKCNRCVENCDTANNLCSNNETCFLSIRQHGFFISAAEEYGQFCNPRLRFIRVDTLQYVGALIGTVIFGKFADTFGRRRILQFALGLGLPALLLSGEVNHVAWFYFFRFFVGIFNGAGLLVGWSYVSELGSAKKRMMLRSFSSWPLARLIMTLVCYLTGEWRMATRILVVIMLPLIPILAFLLPESHVWLASKSRRAEYDESIARINWLAGCVYVKKSEHHFSSKSVRTGMKVGLRTIFARPLLKTRLLVLFSFWFVTFYSYFALDLNSDSMFERDFFLGQFVLCGLLVGTKLVLWLLDRYLPGINRRKLHLGAQAGVVLFVLVIMILYLNGHKGSIAFMLLWFAATISIDLCSDVCHLIVNELMPVEVRGAANLSVSIVARCATVAATFTTAINDLFEPTLYITIILFSIANWFVSYFLLDEKKEADLKKEARAPMQIPRIEIQQADVFVFDNVSFNEGAATEEADKNASEGNDEKSSEEQQKTKTTTAEKDDLGFSDLIFWTTFASNPSYNPTAADATDPATEDGEKGDEAGATVACNSLDGTCQPLQEIILDANMVVPTPSKEVAKHSEPEDDISDQNEAGEDGIIVIRF